MARLTELVAVVVGAIAYGEADRVVRLLSAESGRTAVLVRGARSARNRHPGLDVGSRVRLSLRHGRGGLPVVAEVDPLSLPRRARQDLDRVALLAYGCEICAALAPEHHESEKLFRLLEVWLALLEQEAAVGASSRIALEGKALTFAGLAPALVVCARCGEPVDDPVVFDLESGGALHARCGAGRAISVDVLAHLEVLRRTPLHDTPAYPPPSTHRWVLSDFVRHQLGQAIRSRALLEELEGATRGERPG